MNVQSAPVHTNRLAGRVALITGGARGQGAAHALRLADEGAIVYISDLLDEVGEAEAERLRGRGETSPTCTTTSRTPTAGPQ